jgi:hypothetical protein
VDVLTTYLSDLLLLSSVLCVSLPSLSLWSTSHLRACRCGRFKQELGLRIKSTVICRIPSQVSFWKLIKCPHLMENRNVFDIKRKFYHFQCKFSSLFCLNSDCALVIVAQIGQCEMSRKQGFCVLLMVTARSSHYYCTTDFLRELEQVT